MPRPPLTGFHKQAGGSRGRGTPARSRPPARPAQPPSRPAQPLAPVKERKIYGVNACRAFFLNRPAQLIRAWFTEDTARRYFGEVMRYCAANRLAYHVVPDTELEKVTSSAHHEGVCFLVVEDPPLTLEAFLEGLPRHRPACIVALEGVGNPHNLGAILRSSAHFGTKAVLMVGASSLMNGATLRTAEGGAEAVAMVEAGNLLQALQRLQRAGFSILSTSSHRGTDLYRTRLPERLVVLLGEEAAGLSGAALATGDLQVSIPGTGAVESLNVSVALGVILGEYWRQRQAG